MLLLLTRIVADHSVGAEFFGNYYLMDYELMGGNARDAAVPFGSHEWQWIVTPGSGPTTIEQLLSP